MHTLNLLGTAANMEHMGFLETPAATAHSLDLRLIIPVILGDGIDSDETRKLTIKKQKNPNRSRRTHESIKLRKHDYTKLLMILYKLQNIIKQFIYNLMEIGEG